MGDLDGRHVLITGAGRGLGRACALAAAAAGTTVRLVARNVAGLDAVVGEIRHRDGSARVAPADVTDAETISEVVGDADRASRLGWSTRRGPTGPG